MSLGMRKLATMMAAIASLPYQEDNSVYHDVGGHWRHPHRGITRLKGPDYSEVPPVLARGKRRTLALKLAQVVNWHDERANLYGCHPCPKCGEVRFRCAIKRSYGNTIECAACGDKRPVRTVIG